ncbi:MAG TPA: TonB-dependent receptor [Bryobacteraceae bacterium]|nr:TonB-dependent receptor [Bryobacteraceae bacterium]
MRSHLGVVTSFFLAAALLHGQANVGSIVGTASDATGAVVPNAKITVANVQTGVATATMTDSLGNYLVQFLPPGSYQVTAEASGFKKFVRTNIVLDAVRQLRVDIPLETGAVTETVNVNAAPPLVETETGSMSTTVENSQVVRLPLISRDPQTFRLLVPGVVDGENGPVTQGGLVRKDPYYIDGAHSSRQVWSGTATNPNPDVIQEFKVLTNSYSAEYGESSGALMVSTTKSGTNDFHGDLFEFLRNDKINAGNYYNHTTPILRYNQFGGTVGGPIRKNKTFFFFDMQFTRVRGTGAFNNLSVPDSAMRSGDFSELLGGQVGLDAMGRPVNKGEIFDPLTTTTYTDATGKQAYLRDPFPGNRIPSARFSPAALKVQALFPLPTVNAPFANYSSFGSNQSNKYEYDIKFDHNFSDKDKLMLRYGRVQSESNPPQPFPGNAGGGPPGTLGYGPVKEPDHQIVVEETHIFNPTTTNDIHLSWWQVFPKRTVAGYGSVGTADFGIHGMPNANDKLGTPDFNFQNFARLGSSYDTLFFELQNSNALTDNLSLMRGRHAIKIGGEVRHLRTDNFQPLPGNTRWFFQNTFTDQVGFSQTGFDYASFLLGVPVQMNYHIFPSYFSSRGSVYALYVQDDIRVSRKLTINAGLRWDAPLWYHEKLNRSGVFDLNQGQYVQFGTNGFRDTPWDNNYFNWGPRFGFAYSPFSNSKLVVRGGFGIFSVGTMSSGANAFMPFDPIFADADVGRYNTTDFVHWNTTLDSIPYAPADKTGKNAKSISLYPDYNAMTHMQQWNFNVENEIKGIMVEVGYAGSHGLHLPYGGYNLNAIPVNLAPQARGQYIAPYVLYPQYPAGVSVNAWLGSSSYNSLQIKAERRFSSGLGFIAAYTYEKLIDVGQVGYRDPLNNRNLDRGVGPDSVPQRLTVAFNYALPFGVGQHWLSTGPLTYFLGGWELNGIVTQQSGFPMTPGINFDTCVCGSIARPNVIGDPVLSGSQRSLNQWFNVSAFAPPPLYTIGNSGRGLFLSPGLSNMDMSVAKRFYFEKFREGSNLEFRAEFFNFFNTPYFSDPNTTIGTATAGRVTSVRNNARQAQMALKFYF